MLTPFLSPFLYQFSAVVQNFHLIWCYLGQICIRFRPNQIDAETAPSNGAILDEFSEQH